MTDAKLLSQGFRRPPHQLTTKRIRQSLPNAVDEFRVAETFAPSHLPRNKRGATHALDSADDLHVRILALNILVGVDERLEA